MGHSVHLIIGQGPAIASFQRIWPAARVVDLLGGWQAIPVDDALHTAIEAHYPGAHRPSGLDVSPLGLGEALSDATKAGGGLAYVETEYFGGTGGQAAMAYVDGRQAMSPQSSRGGGGPINQALRLVGVTRTAADDEFDTIGLGERRTMTDYEPEGPVRLRTSEKEEPAPPTDSGKAFVPVWQVVMVIVAVIAVGLFISAAG
jgi:hypothetical protein